VYFFASIPAVNWLLLLVTALGIEKGPFPASWLGQCLLVAAGAGAVFAIITRPNGNGYYRAMAGILLVGGSIWLTFGGWFVSPPEIARFAVSRVNSSRLKEAMDKATAVRGRPGESVTIIAPADGGWVKLYGSFSAPHANVYWGNETSEMLDGPGRPKLIIPRGGWIAVRSAGVKPVKLRVRFEK
jgi:hypothetical protein